MGIVVFDIDGTLTDTTEVDVECYEAAVLEEIGLVIPGDWPAFDDVTDSAILAVACERQGMPVPAPAVQSRMAERVGELLDHALRRDPERFRPIAGAREVFALLESAGWSVAMATGAWRPSALVKLRGGSIPHDGVPLATSSDHHARAEIILHAVQAVSHDQAPVVYVGDGVWDGRAAKSLGYSFIGVGQGARASELRAVGASAVVADFADGAAFLRHVRQAGA